MTFAKYMKLLETSGSPQLLKLKVQKMYFNNDHLLRQHLLKNLLNDKKARL